MYHFKRAVNLKYCQDMSNLTHHDNHPPFQNCMINRTPYWAQNVQIVMQSIYWSEKDFYAMSTRSSGVGMIS